MLVSWRQRVLERQIEYGARLGHVVLSLARMELSNFYKSVMPVADYFDQSNMLIAVSLNIHIYYSIKLYLYIYLLVLFFFYLLFK